MTNQPLRRLLVLLCLIAVLPAWSASLDDIKKLIAAGKYEEAEKALDPMLSAQKVDAATLGVAVDMFVSQGRYFSASKHATTLVDGPAKDDAARLLQAADIARMTGDYSKAVDRYQRFIAKAGKGHAQHREALKSLLVTQVLLQNNPQVAYDAMGQYLDAYGMTPDMASQARSVLNGLAATGSRDRFYDLMGRVLDKTPEASRGEFEAVYLARATNGPVAYRTEQPSSIVEFCVAHKLVSLEIAKENLPLLSYAAGMNNPTQPTKERRLELAREYSAMLMNKLPPQEWPQGVIAWHVVGHQMSNNAAISSKAAAAYKTYADKAWGTNDRTVRERVLAEMTIAPAPEPDAAILADLTRYVAELNPIFVAKEFQSLHQLRNKLGAAKLKDAPAYAKLLEETLKSTPDRDFLVMYFEAEKGTSPTAALALGAAESRLPDRFEQYAAAIEWAPLLEKDGEIAGLVQAAISFNPHGFQRAALYKTNFAENEKVSPADKVKVLTALSAKHPSSRQLQALVADTARYLSANGKTAEGQALEKLLAEPAAADAKNPWSSFPAFADAAGKKDVAAYSKLLASFIETHKPAYGAKGAALNDAAVMADVVTFRLPAAAGWNHDQRIQALMPVATSIDVGPLLSDLGARNRWAEVLAVGGPYLTNVVLAAKTPYTEADLQALHADVIGPLYTAIDRTRQGADALKLLGPLASSDLVTPRYRAQTMGWVSQRLRGAGGDIKLVDDFLTEALKQDPKRLASDEAVFRNIVDQYTASLNNNNRPSEAVVTKLEVLGKAAGVTPAEWDRLSYDIAARASSGYRGTWLSRNASQDLSKLSLQQRRVTLARMYNLAAHEGWNSQLQEAKRNYIVVNQWLPAELEFLRTDFGNTQTFSGTWQTPWKHTQEFYANVGSKTPALKKEWDAKLSDLSNVMADTLQSVTDPHLNILITGIGIQAEAKDIASLKETITMAARSIRGKDADSDIRRVVLPLRDQGLNELAASFLTLMTSANDQLPSDARKTAEILLADMAKHIGNSGAIPVPKNSPEYDLYLASRHYVFGERDRAIELLAPKANLLQTHWSGLNPDFVIFALNWMRKQGQLSEVTTATRQMLLSSDTMPAEMQAGIQLVQADVVRDKEEYQLAITSYNGIIQNNQLKDTASGRLAVFHLIETYLATRNYDAATQKLEVLMDSQDRETKAHAYLLMAEMAFALDDNDAAKDHLAKVIGLDYFVGEATILRNRIALKERDLEIIIESEFGDAAMRKYVVPGQAISISINDENLRIARAGQAIDVEMISSNGDREIVKLYASNTSTKKFSGKIMPELGKATPGNNRLEVLGGATVKYNISEQLRKERQEDIAWATMTVVTNATLSASSGEFKTEDQRKQDEYELELRMRQGDVSKQDLGRDPKTIRPGNPIYVQIKDPDMGSTDQPDNVLIRMTTKSGDVVDAYAVKETGPYTGLFQAIVPTSVPLPRASASDTLEGSEPGWVINSTIDKAWESARDMQRPKWLEVDIQQPQPIARMEVTMANDRKVKSVSLLASRVNMDFKEVASMPATSRVHGGKSLAGIDVEVVFPGGEVKALGKSPEAIRQALVDGDVKRGLMTSTVYRRDKFTSWGSSQDQSNIRLFGYFYVEKARQVTMRGVARGGKTSIAHIYIDDVKRTNDFDRAAPFTVTLSPGIHTFEMLGYLEGLRAEFTPEYLDDKGEWQELPSDWFDAAVNPQLVDAWKPVAKINSLGDKLIVEFTTETRYRQFRLVFKDFAGDSVSVKEVKITNRQNAVVVPGTSDFSTATKNQTLEIASDDEIVVQYIDAKRTDDAANTPLTETLSSSFFDAEVSLNLEVMADDRNRNSTFHPAKRVKVGDSLMIHVEDWDMDSSGEKDVVDIVVEATGQKPLQLKARESQAHSGIFEAVLNFGDAVAPNTVVLTPGAEVKIKYFDSENTRPGVGVDREFMAYEAGSTTAKVKVLSTETRLDSVVDDTEGQKKKTAQRGEAERMVLKKQIVATYPVGQDVSRTSIDAPLLFFVESPSDAFNALSELKGTVISKSMQAAGEQPIPMTLRLDPIESLASSKGYGSIRYLNLPQQDKLDMGLFAGIVRLQLGRPGDPIDNKVFSVNALAGNDGNRRGKEDANTVPTIIVQGSDEIIVTIDSRGSKVTQTVTLYCDGQINFVDRTFEERREGFYLGESLNIQLVDYDLDKTEDYDTTTVKLVASGGDVIQVELRETLKHSGIFTGSLRPEFRKEGEAANKEDQTLSIAFGETLTATFQDTNHIGGQTPVDRTSTLEVYLGSDGVVNTFSKQYKDEDIAVRTAFTIAEAYFELAKEHRKLEKTELADEEIAIGKRLLHEAMAAYPNTKYASQATYLLANLAQELGGETGNYDEAISGYTSILQQWPDSDYAPKSQFKLALCYEQMERWDQAVEEYVKITYRYPDNPLVASVIIRLGQYFWKTENYMVAGDVFKSFQKRFPDHLLASKAMLLSGQSYIKAKNYIKAIEILTELVETYTDDRDVRAESMYWLGDSQRNNKLMEDSYKTLKKLTWDYPETKWAKMARALLVGEEYSRIEERLSK